MAKEEGKTLSLVRRKLTLSRTVRRLLKEMPKSTRNRVNSYWDSLDSDSKKEFLRIKVDDLTSHFKTPETPDCKMEGFVQRAVLRARAGLDWITWVCFTCEDCPKEFDDSESHWQHFVHKHMGNVNVSPELQRFLPECVDDQWIEMIGHCSWKPLDYSAAIEMLENQAKSEEDGGTEAIKDWPLSDDSKRAELLKKIKEGFDMLIKHKYLAASHVTHLVKLAKDEILGLAGSQIVIQALDQSVDCICFLGAPGLKKVFKFLLELVHACGLVLNSNRSTNPMNDLHNLNQVPEIKEEIRLSEDGSYLLLDGCLVTATGATNEGAAMEDVISNIDSFLPWIFSGSCLGQWLLWQHIKHKERDLVSVLVQVLEKISDLLNKSLEEKCGLTNYDKALKVLEDLCREEADNENFTESLLRERKEELSNSEEHVRDTSELDAMTNVLEEAQKIKVNESGIDKNYIKTAIERLKQTQSEKIGKIDGVILKHVAEMDRSKLQLRRVSHFDYRIGFLPLVKAYLKARLVAAAERDAKEKSDAAGDALLVELAEESNKDVKGGSDSAKQSEKTTKNKKSNKQNRKTNELKATDDAELTLDELAEELVATYEDEQHVLDTTTADHSSAAPDEKSPHEVRLEEIEAQKKKLTETEKELEKAEKLIEEMTTELEEKEKWHAEELKVLGEEDQEKIKKALKSHAERDKELEAEGKFIQDMITELTESQKCLAKQRKEMAIEEERIKNALFWSQLNMF